MNPALIELAIRVLITYGPAAYRAVVELFHNQNPTKDDFLALLEFATQKSYDDYIAAAGGQPAKPPSA